MILDTVDNLRKYESLNPLFGSVVEYLSTHNLAEMPLGKHEIQGEKLYVNIVDSAPKKQSDAKIESHRQMIDIQIPISGPEKHGYTPLSELPDSDYNSTDDISFYPEEASTYFTVHPGEMVIYFPTDGHAPAITDVTLRKAIFKVKF